MADPTPMSAAAYEAWREIADKPGGGIIHLERSMLAELLDHVTVEGHPPGLDLSLGSNLARFLDHLTVEGDPPAGWDLS